MLTLKKLNTNVNFGSRTEPWWTIKADIEALAFGNRG
jgi:hypothetical protein